MLSHALYVSDQPFTDWTLGSPIFLQTVQLAFNVTFMNISCSLSLGDSVVRVVRSCDYHVVIANIP
jgi:hypothetical protein